MMPSRTASSASGSRCFEEGQISHDPQHGDPRAGVQLFKSAAKFPGRNAQLLSKSKEGTIADQRKAARGGVGLAVAPAGQRSGERLGGGWMAADDSLSRRGLTEVL